MKLIATVEHTGFREWVVENNHHVVELKYENDDDASAWGDRPWEDAFLHAHLTDENMPMILEAAKRMPCFTTHRNEDDVRESWVKRRKDLADLSKQLRNYAKFIAEASPTIIERTRE